MILPVLEMSQGDGAPHLLSFSELGDDVQNTSTRINALYIFLPIFIYH